MKTNRTTLTFNAKQEEAVAKGQSEKDKEEQSRRLASATRFELIKTLFGGAQFILPVVRWDGPMNATWTDSRCTEKL